MICSITVIISLVVILSSDTYVARFTTHLGTDLAGIPINNSNSTTSYEDPSQLETNSASIYSSKKLTTFWRNGASNTRVSGPDISKVNGDSVLKKSIKIIYYFESKSSFVLFWISIIHWWQIIDLSDMLDMMSLFWKLESNVIPITNLFDHTSKSFFSFPQTKQFMCLIDSIIT